MIETIATLVTLCKEALAGVKWTKQEYDAKKLSPEEKAILQAAADQGIIQIVRCECLLVVFAGNTDFQNFSDPTYRARHFSAFAQLCDKGLIDSQGDSLFCLNGKGFEVARSLPAAPKQLQHVTDDE
jgi:hypothetical protein